MNSEFAKPGCLAWVSASVADVRAQASHAAEQVTQALQGQVLVPLDVSEGWIRLRLPDEYEGWVRDWHLVPTTQQQVAAFQQRCNARVTRALSTVRAEPSFDAMPVAETILGTALIGGETSSGWIAVQLPGVVRGWLPKQELRADTEYWPREIPSILAMMQRFIGVPYVWGGKSPKGFDCSGLVQFVFGLHGLPLPRDSVDQFAAGVAGSAAPVAGDLLFFGEPDISHVAVQFDDGCYLHARGMVRFNSLDAQHALYDAALAKQYRGFRRLLPQKPSGCSAS